jgi:hypothetical protein
MHPLNNRNFGHDVGKVAIDFYDGSATVTGYVVKQVGTKSFVVSANGTTNFVAHLAQDTANASTLSAGLATIKAQAFGSNTVEHVMSIQANLITTTEGNQYQWTLGPATKAGQAHISSVVTFNAGPTGNTVGG